MTLPILSQDRLVARDAALGFLRERTYPQEHIGLSIAPFQSVLSDEVIFQYVQANGAGMAPARAEDAEAEMAYKEETFGEGRASLIDWAIKDSYKTSDVTRYREGIYLNGLINPASAPVLPLTVDSVITDFQQRVARDSALRRTKLDNRLEWLTMSALFANQIVYNDGKIITTVPYGRPVAQSPVGGCSATTVWSSASADPINDVLTLQNNAFDLYGVEIDHAICSRRVIRNVLNSAKFAARTGLAGATGPAAASIDPWYVVDGWGYDAALAVLQRATGVTFRVYDSVMRTRARGATTLTNTRFSPDDSILFLPSDSSVNQLDDAIGFGKMLTSPHPAGNWQSGFYEWEKDHGQDPWRYDVGSGIKAWPVLPHMDLTWLMKVLPNGTALQTAY